MPEDVTARQARQAEYYQQKKAAGLVTVRDWCYPKDRAAVHRFCADLRNLHLQREREEAK